MLVPTAKPKNVYLIRFIAFLSNTILRTRTSFFCNILIWFVVKSTKLANVGILTLSNALIVSESYWAIL